MPIEIGDKLGPYRIEAQLGRGGMAIVYKAYHTALDRYDALKVLHANLTDDRTFAERFGREAKVVANLRHQNIMPVYNYETDGEYPYLAMHYIEGETLKTRLRRGPLTSQEITQIVKSVGGALHHAHTKGVLHRDIKPSNVMISKDDEIFLTDFGLARIMQDAESTLSKDVMLGTPQYISPEQARGDEMLDAGTDIYSFGVLIYELVVGRVPFNADTPYAIVHDHIYSPLPLPSQINSEVPDEIEQILLKALAKERKDRYQTIEEMVDAYVAAVEAVGDDAIEVATKQAPRAVAQIKPASSGVAKAPTQSTTVGESTAILPAGASGQPGGGQDKRTAKKADSDIKIKTRPERIGSVSQRPATARRSRKGAWPLVGFVLLVASLLAGGIVLSRAISEEYQRTFINDLQQESGWNSGFSDQMFGS